MNWNVLKSKLNVFNRIEMYLIELKCIEIKVKSIQMNWNVSKSKLNVFKWIEMYWNQS